jgi:hypothetical protein
VNTDESSLVSLLDENTSASAPDFASAGMFVVGLDTSMMIDRHHGNVPKLRSIAEQCIAGWQSANETIERLRAARANGFTK